MMRKILFLATMLVASFGISSVANAKINDKQVDYENRNEIAISYGVYSNSQVISFYEDIIAIMVTGSRGYFDHDEYLCFRHSRDAAQGDQRLRRLSDGRTGPGG